MDNLNTKDMSVIHEINLKIISEFQKICDDNNLIYFLSGGSLLGAIRHKGFIPWDDDADFQMPRDDYEKFLKIAPGLLSRNIKICNYKTDPNYHYYITRLQDVDTKVEEVRIGNEEEKYTHISIDLFPIDGTPNNLIKRKLYFVRIMMHRAFMSLCYKDSIDKDRKRSIKEKILLKLMLIIPIEKILNAYKEKEKIDSLMRRYKISHSDNIGSLMGAYRTNQIVPKEYFGKGKYYQFEHLNLRGPELYDSYLKQMYGDYMRIPDSADLKVHYKIIEIKEKKSD